MGICSIRSASLRPDRSPNRFLVIFLLSRNFFGGTRLSPTVTPVRGTGPNDLKLQHQAEATMAVTVPTVKRDGIATWFNRAVVSSLASYREFPRPLPPDKID